MKEKNTQFKIMKERINDNPIYLITSLLILVEILSKLLEYRNFYQISFILEMLGLTFIVLLTVVILSNSSEISSFNNIFGISKTNWILILSASLLISIPWWLEECIDIGKITIVRRALGEYSFSTLVKAPIFEEFYFRGILLWFLREKYDDKKSAKLNGILFSLIHLPFAIFGINLVLFTLLLFTGLFGYILSRIQLKYQNLSIPIILHFIANLVLILIGFPAINQSNNSC